MNTVTSRRLIDFTAITSLILIIMLSFYWYRTGVFNNISSLQTYLRAAGLIGPILFIIIQVIQVVIPIIPGGISLAAGVLLFGGVTGFVCNYIGIVIGSCINFLLARRYGKSFILHIVKEQTFEKYMQRTKNQKKFNWFFGLAILLPIAPDDILCLIAGLTKMKFQTFLKVILFGKPASIAAYSFGLLFGAQTLFKVF